MLRMNRREFLRAGLAASAVSIADWRIFAAEEGLPTYYGEHLAKVAARVGKLAIYHNDVATISQDGVLTALKPGESVVVALAENGDKELFPVSVSRKA